MTKKKLAFAGLISAVALVALAAGPCVEQRSLDNGLGHFKVTLTNIDGVTGGSGSKDDPYDFAPGDVTFTFNVSAYDKQGRIMDGQEGRLSFDKSVSVLVFPGPHAGFVSKPWRPQQIQLTAGSASGVQAVGTGLYGRAMILVADIRVEEGEPAPGLLYDIPQDDIQGTYAMGASRDVYFGQPTLHDIQINDRIMAEQDIDTSALPRRFVQVDCRLDEPAQGLPDDGHGKLVVTGIFNEGYYVTDVAGAADGFNHLYVYTYSYPEDLVEGDRLDRLVGTSQDFSGATQVSFPSWKRATDESLDPEPFRVQDIDSVVPPTLLTSAICNEGSTSNLHMCGHSKQDWSIENLESSRVRLENIRTPDIYVDCDFNSNGEITFSYPSPDEETDCRDACLLHDGSGVITATTVIAKPEVLSQIAIDPCQDGGDCTSGQCGGYTQEDMNDGLCRIVCPWEEAIEGIRPNCIQVRVPPQYICSELSTYKQWGQWVVALDDGSGPLINLVTNQSLVEFNPTDEQNLGITIDYVQGNLAQRRAARPRWMVFVGKSQNDAPPSMRP